jgi:hypothetical protein
LAKAPAGKDTAAPTAPTPADLIIERLEIIWLSFPLLIFPATASRHASSGDLGRPDFCRRVLISSDRRKNAMPQKWIIQLKIYFMTKRGSAD